MNAINLGALDQERGPPVAAMKKQTYKGLFFDKINITMQGYNNNCATVKL